MAPGAAGEAKLLPLGEARHDFPETEGIDTEHEGESREAGRLQRLACLLAASSLLLMAFAMALGTAGGPSQLLRGTGGIMNLQDNQTQSDNNSQPAGFAFHGPVVIGEGLHAGRPSDTAEQPAGSKKPPDRADFCNFVTTHNYEDGTYCGPVVDGLEDTTQFSGVDGAYFYLGGTIYEGQFKAGFRHGQGTYYANSGATVEGQWKNGHIFNGTMRWPDGRSYTGGFRGCQPYCIGTEVTADGTTLKGQWKDGLMVNGTESWRNGAKYVGKMVSPFLPNGRGKFLFEDGRVLDADWKKGESLNGTLTLTNGTKIYMANTSSLS